MNSSLGFAVFCFVLSGFYVGLGIASIIADRPFVAVAMAGAFLFTISVGVNNLDYATARMPAGRFYVEENK